MTIWAGMMLGALALTFGVPVAGSGSGAASTGAADMDAHMKMTALRPKQPGDQARGDAIVAAARTVAEHYKDFHTALAEGYSIFMPNQKQGVYHFVKDEAESGAFDAGKPPALLYDKTAEGYKLVGVMYMAPFGATEAELNARVPLSVGQWHVHTNMCVPPNAAGRNWLMGDSRFGLDGSIANAADCRVAGGRFVPHLSGWMVHVYPFEKDPAKVWAAGMNDDHLHEGMPGMKM